MSSDRLYKTSPTAQNRNKTCLDTLNHSNGFTLIEVLVALVITAMGAVSLGYFMTGSAQAQLEADIIASATISADTVMKLMVLHGSQEHASVQEHIKQARSMGQKITLSTVPATLLGQTCYQMQVTVFCPELKSPVVVTRFRPISPDVDPRNQSIAEVYR